MVILNYTVPLSFSVISLMGVTISSIISLAFPLASGSPEISTVVSNSPPWERCTWEREYHSLNCEVCSSIIPYWTNWYMLYTPSFLGQNLQFMYSNRFWHAKIEMLCFMILGESNFRWHFLYPVVWINLLVRSWLQHACKSTLAGGLWATKTSSCERWGCSASEAYSLAKRSRYMTCS